MRNRILDRLALAAALVAVAACAPADEQEEPSMQETGMPEMQAPAPDTTAAALWAHLEGSNYSESYALWPDKGELYAGQEPHGMLLTTYLNDLALDALTNGAGAMPNGAIVVKENYMPDSTLAAITIMYKAEGYNPDVGDWFWVKRLADGTVEASGRVAGCIGCHGQQAANDYLFTGQLGGMDEME
ncbi:MAG: cytochrome P460 family protein [Gemmatimonadales bacterium]|jgi:hypothetical protein